MDLNIGARVHVVGEGGRGDGLKQEICFHPRHTVIHREVRVHRGPGGRAAARGDIEDELWAVGNRGVFGHGTVVGGAERSDDHRKVGGVGAGCLLGDGGDIEFQRTVAGQQHRWLPIASVSHGLCTGFGPEEVVSVHDPRSIGTVPETVHVGDVGLEFGGSESIGGALQLNARFMNGVAAGVVHWKSEQQPRFLCRSVCQRPGDRSVVGAGGRGGCDVRISVNRVVGNGAMDGGFVFEFGPPLHGLRERKIGEDEHQHEQKCRGPGRNNS